MIHTSKTKKNTVEIKCKCPVCKSENVKENAKYQSNGIIGPGCSSWKCIVTGKQIGRASCRERVCQYV